MRINRKILLSSALFGSMLVQTATPILAFDAREEPTHILVQDSYLLNPQDVTQGTEGATPAPDLNVSDGSVKDEKSAGYANEDDQKESIVTITHNIQGKSMLVDQPMNFLFILDCSSSMSSEMSAAENQCTITFAEQLLRDNPRNKIGVIYFESRLCQKLDFTSDISAIRSFTTHKSHGGTDFDAALRGADALIRGAADAGKLNKNAPLYTIFMTDGGSSVTQADAYKANLFNTFSMHTVYGVGICMDEVNAGITAVASPGKAIACPDLTSFTSAMNGISKSMQEGYPKGVVLEENVNERFDLILDESHPIVIDGKSYTSKDSLPAGFTYESNKLTYNMGDMKKETANHTLSYCVKEIAEKQAGVESVTNNSGITFTPAKVQDNKIVYDPTPKRNTLYEPQYATEESKVSAELKSNLETETVIARDAAVSYTLRIRNEGQLDLENFYANIEIPEGMDYLSAEEPVFADAASESTEAEGGEIVAKAAEDEDLGLDLDLDAGEGEEGEEGENPAEEDKAGYDPETGKVYYKIEKLEKGQSLDLTVNVTPNGTAESMTAIAGIGLTEESNIQTNDITHTLEEIVILPPNEPVKAEKKVEKSEKHTTGLSQANYLIIAGAAVVVLAIIGGATIFFKKKNKKDN